MLGLGLFFVKIHYKNLMRKREASVKSTRT